VDVRLPEATDALTGTTHLRLSNVGWTDVDGELHTLESWAAELRARLDPGWNNLQKLARLRAFVFEELGFRGDRTDYYQLHTLDTYRTLYTPGRSDDDRAGYIRSRLALADWIVMDDTFLDFYQHLPESEHRVVRQYYRDLFAGRLGFRLVKTFKVYPSLFGHDIVDDGAELTFRLFDHPRVFVFSRS